MPILSSADDYKDVRRKVSDGLSAQAWPDTTIQRSVYQGEAEEEIEQRVGSYEDLTDAQKVHARRAAIYLTAALIAPDVTGIAYAASDGNFDYLKFDGLAKAQELRGMAEQELAEVVEPDAEDRVDSPYSCSVPVVVVW